MNYSRLLITVTVSIIALYGFGGAQTQSEFSLEAGEAAFLGPAPDSCAIDQAQRGIAWSYGVSPSANPGVYEIHYGQSVAKLFASTEAWHGATDGPNVNPLEFYATQEGGSLYRIDPKAATITEVGNYGGPTIRELAFKEPNQVLYGTDYDKLYVINQATGVATLIGDMIVGGVTDVDEFWAMDYDEASKELLAISQATNTLYKVDVTNAQLTTIGPTNTDRLTDIWYDKNTGNIYAVSNGEAGNKHYTVSRDNGATTALAGGAEFCCNLLGLGDITFQPRDIPSHTNLGILILTALLLLSGLYVIYRRRRGVMNVS